MLCIDKRPPENKVPVIFCNATEEEQTFAVHAALVRLAVADPELGSLPLMVELRLIAYDRFLAAFELG